MGYGDKEGGGVGKNGFDFAGKCADKPNEQHTSTCHNKSPSSKDKKMGDEDMIGNKFKLDNGEN